MDPLNHVVIMIMQEPKLESNPFFFLCPSKYFSLFFFMFNGGCTIIVGHSHLMVSRAN